MPSEYRKIAKLLKELRKQKKHPFPQKRESLDAPKSHGVYPAV
jgi:hypothetical protein